LDWESTVRRQADTTLGRQLESVLEWLTDRGDAEKMVVQYWRTRDVAAVSSLSETIQRILSHIDVATDAFWADDDSDRGHAAHSVIGEQELRTELLQYVRDIQRSGYLRDWPVPGDG
jgi:hypothetical protein